MTCRWATNTKNRKRQFEDTYRKDNQIRFKKANTNEIEKKTQPRQSHQRGPQMQQKKHENRTQGCGLLRTCTANGVPRNVDVFSNTGVQIWSTNFEFFRSKHACVKAEEVCSTPADTPALTQEATTYHTKILPA